MHQLETLLIVLHENQQEDILFQGFPEIFSPPVKTGALKSRLSFVLSYLGTVVRKPINLIQD